MLEYWSVLVDSQEAQGDQERSGMHTRITNQESRKEGPEKHNDPAFERAPSLSPPGSRSIWDVVETLKETQKSHRNTTLTETEKSHKNTTARESQDSDHSLTSDVQNSEENTDEQIAESNKSVTRRSKRKTVSESLSKSNISRKTIPNKSRNSRNQRKISKSLHPVQVNTTDGTSSKQAVIDPEQADGDLEDLGADHSDPEVSPKQPDLIDDIDEENEDEFDITNKIPIAHSTAIHFEQDLEDDSREEIGEEEKEHDEDEDKNEPSHSESDAEIENEPQHTEETGSARKKRRTAHASTTKVNEIETPRRKSRLLRSVNERKETQQALPDTPALRHHVTYASFAQAFAQVSQSYIVVTPKAVEDKPVKQTKATKPRKRKADDNEKAGENNEPGLVEIPLWQGPIENKRTAKDVTDLDIVLNCIQEHTWNFKETLENGTAKNTVRLFGKETVKDLREMIEKVQTLKNSKLSRTRGDRVLKRKRKELLQVQREYSDTRYALATLQVQLNELQEQYSQLQSSDNG